MGHEKYEGISETWNCISDEDEVQNVREQRHTNYFDETGLSDSCLPPILEQDERRKISDHHLMIIDQQIGTRSGSNDSEGTKNFHHLNSPNKVSPPPSETKSLNLAYNLP